MDRVLCATWLKLPSCTVQDVTVALWMYDSASSVLIYGIGVVVLFLLLPPAMHPVCKITHCEGSSKTSSFHFNTSKNSEPVS